MSLDPQIPLSTQLPNLANPLGIYQQAQAIRIQQQQADALEEERQQRAAYIQQQNEALQRKQQQDATLDGLMKNAFIEDPDTGVATFHRGAFEQGLVKSNLGHLYPSLSETLDKLDASAAKINSEKRQMYAQGIAAIQRTGNTPDSVLSTVAYLRRNGVLDDAHARPILDAVAANPDPQAIGAMLDKIGGSLPEYKALQDAEAKRKMDAAKEQAEIDTKLHPNVAPGQGVWNQQTGKYEVPVPAKPDLPPAAKEYEYAVSKGYKGTFEQYQNDDANRHKPAVDDPLSPKNQQRLEQQYRTVLQRTVSSRSGGLGLEDQKVNQALHLLALMDQNKDANGNYTIPAQGVTELALGLARLMSPNGNVGVQLEESLNPSTLQGNVGKAIQFVTGSPMKGTSQQLFQWMRDSIERQGRTSEQNRESYFDSMRALAPTDLEESRREQIEKSLQLNRIPAKAAPAAKEPPKPKAGTIRLFTPDGRAMDVPPQDVAGLIKQGAHF